MRAHLRRAGAITGLGVLALLAAWLLGQTEPMRALEDRTLDWRFLARGPKKAEAAESGIILVLVEEEADLDYRSPIPRRHLAQVIRAVSSARVIGLDIFLDEPSFDEAGDQALRTALRDAGNVVAVSYLDEGEEVLCHPSFGRFLLDHGYASFFTSTETEVVRRGRVGLQLQGSRALALATVILSRLRGWDVDRLRDPATRVLPDGTPLDQTVTIDYAGPPNAIYRERSALAGGFTVCPSHLVAAGVYPPGLFEDKVVLIGSGLADAPDRFRTPYFSAAYGYEKTFGVEIHAQFLSTLMSESGLPRASGWTVTAAVVVTAFGLLGAVLAGHAVWAGVACVVLSVAGWTAAYLLFAAEAVVVPVAWPTASIWIAYGLGLAFYGLTEGRQRRRTRGLFEKYVAPEVVSQLLEDPQTWELGGREVEITVMFADLEGFTPLAERMAAQELVEFMNGYLSEMTAIILEEDGTIDKYEGDLVMAFFGAPVPMDDHAVRACRAAVAMQSRMAALRQEWETQGLPAPRVRIGLHSGTAVVGNMGSELRFNYTAMGDTVNLAARLEQLNKEFGTLTMVSGETRRLVDGAGFELRALGATPVKGKAEPVEVFEVVT